MANEALTLGMGFHQFDGKTEAKEIIRKIGADFSVREDRLVRLPSDVLERALNGEAITIDPKHLITTHKATVHDGFDETIGIVGRDYGVIQNNQAFDILDLMSNSSVTDTPLQIVSAGLVHSTYDPYFQCLLSGDGIIKGDTSNTQFYAFVHTSHDGTSGLKISVSAIRVVCQNTFNANLESLGFTIKHSKYANSRVDLSQEANVKRVQEIITKLNFFKADYIEKMNAFAEAKVDDRYINEFALNLLVNEPDIRKEAMLHNGNLDLVDGASTRSKNMVKSFKDTLYGHQGGQEDAYGTKLWLFNGMTNYFSNVANYGSAKDDAKTKATKRFDNLMNGTANSRMENGMNMLLAA